MTLQSAGEHSHSLSDKDFDSLFTTNIIVSYFPDKIQGFWLNRFLTTDLMRGTGEVLSDATHVIRSVSFVSRM